MKSEFWFPRFKDLQLGPYGREDGCGCLVAKMDEVDSAGGPSTMELRECIERLIGGEEFDRLIFKAPNTIANRRKAYDALVKAVESFGYEIGP